MMAQVQKASLTWMDGTYPWCWLQGEIVETSSASVSVMDRGFLYGDGLFETIRIHQGKLFQWDQHWTRLQTGCDALNMPIFAKKGEWVEHLQALLKKNQTEQGLARIHVSRGPGPRGYAPSNSATPTRLITLHRAPTLPEDKPVSWSLHTSRIRTPSFSAIPKWKTGNKLFQILIKKEAMDAGFDDGIVLNENDHLTETSSANLFLIRSNQLFTPTTECGILNGTTRQLMLRLARSLGLECSEVPCDLAQLVSADSVFVTLCSYGLVHIQRVDNRSIPLHPLEWTLYQAYLKELNAG